MGGMVRCRSAHLSNINANGRYVKTNGDSYRSCCIEMPLPVVVAFDFPTYLRTISDLECDEESVIKKK